MSELRITIARGWPPAINPYRVLHDIELGQAPRGNPEVFPAGQDARTELTEAWQRFWAYGLLWPSMPADWSEEQRQQAWRGLTTSDRAFTNGSGTDTHADHISGRNLDQPEAALDKCRVGGGAVVNVLSEQPVLIRGEEHLTIETLDGSKEPPSATWINYRMTPHLVHLAVIATGSQVIPFPQLDGADVSVPVVSPGGVNYVKRSLLVKLSSYPPASCPYVPARW